MTFSHFKEYLISLRKEHRYCTLIIFALLLLNFNSYAYQKDKVYKITILHTNDHHGHFWKNKHGEYGIAARATLIQKIRDEVKRKGGYTLLWSDLQDAEPDFLAMGMLKYDAMALGNHEFDNPLPVLYKQREWAGFPFLGANIFYKGTNVHAFQTHVIKILDDLKVAIIGFTTKDTNDASHIENSKIIDVRSPRYSRKLWMTLRHPSGFDLS